MTMLGRLESALERVIEGSIAGMFRLRVQPAEIGRRLERAMLDGRVASVGAILAPNLFEVRLHPDDAAGFAEWETALGREMESWLSELAFARGLTTVGPIRVQIVRDETVARRSVRATGRFAANDHVPAATPASEHDLPRPLRLLPMQPGDPVITLNSGRHTLGRADDNDLVLHHPEVSRHHARFEPAGSAWRLVDLGSTNGTWVNGVRVEGAIVAAGDEVMFGEMAYVVGPE